MPIFSIVGDIGSGKTLTACYFCYKAYKNGQKIYSNINFSFPHEKLDNKFFSDYLNHGKQINNCVVFIDEAYIYLDSRMTGTAQNRTLTYFILQTRKKNVTLIYTSQFLGQCDIRLRNNTDRVVYPKLYKNCNNSGQDVCKFAVQTPDGRTRKRMFVANLYYKLYDTKEIVSFEATKNDKN